MCEKERLYLYSFMGLCVLAMDATFSFFQVIDPSVFRITSTCITTRRLSVVCIGLLDANKTLLSSKLLVICLFVSERKILVAVDPVLRG